MREIHHWNPLVSSAILEPFKSHLRTDFGPRNYAEVEVFLVFAWCQLFRDVCQRYLFWPKFPRFRTGGAATLAANQDTKLLV